MYKGDPLDRGDPKYEQPLYQGYPSYTQKHIDLFYEHFWGALMMQGTDHP